MPNFKETRNVNTTTWLRHWKSISHRRKKLCSKCYLQANCNANDSFNDGRVISSSCQEHACLKRSQREASRLRWAVRIDSTRDVTTEVVLLPLQAVASAYIKESAYSLNKLSVCQKKSPFA